MLSLPAVKGFELGSGFRGTQVRRGCLPLLIVLAGHPSPRASRLIPSRCMRLWRSTASPTSAPQVRGSVHNDAFVPCAPPPAAAEGGTGASLPPLLRTASNHAGGTLGGITSGAPLEFRVAIKPVSTIGRAQVGGGRGRGGDARTSQHLPPCCNARGNGGRVCRRPACPLPRHG